MTTHIKTLLAMSAWLAFGLMPAQAQTSADFTVVSGGPAANMPGFELSLPPGSGTLAFSDDALHVLAIMGIQTTPIGPATGTKNIDGTAIRITSPITSVSGTFRSDALNNTEASITGTQIGMLGGLRMVAPRTALSSATNSLSVTNLSVDLATQGIYADISSADRLTPQRVRVWDYAHIDGALGLADHPSWHNPPSGDIYANQTITGLTITDQAFELFVRGLGQRAGGIAALSSVTDYGTLTIAIPEPSTYLMMGLGLVGLSLVARRQRAV